MNHGKTRVSLSDRAYERIKDALCEGKIAAGDILSESQLAAELEMSRTPVREALHALASEGWVEIRRGVGTYVKPLSSKDMEDLYEVRCLLEVQAAKTAVYHISEQEIDSLESQFRAIMEDCDQNRQPDLERFSALDWALHELIVDRCQNSYIKSITRNNNLNLKRYQMLSIEALGDIRESSLQHLNILSILRGRDREGFAEALHSHLVWAAGLLKRP